MDVMRDNPPKGWDAADAVDGGWDKDRLDGFMRDTVRPWSPPAPPAEKSAAPAGPVAPAAPVPDVQGDRLKGEPIYGIFTKLLTGQWRCFRILRSASTHMAMILCELSRTACRRGHSQSQSRARMSIAPT